MYTWNVLHILKIKLIIYKKVNPSCTMQNKAPFMMCIHVMFDISYIKKENQSYIQVNPSCTISNKAPLLCTLVYAFWKVICAWFFLYNIVLKYECLSSIRIVIQNKNKSNLKGFLNLLSYYILFGSKKMNENIITGKE